MKCERCGEVNPAEIHTCTPQEPVAWGVPNTRPTEKAQFMMLLHSPDGCQYPEQLVSLYTAPPPREWVGLTEAERLEIIAVGGEAAVLYVTEAKLREKNSG